MAVASVVDSVAEEAEEVSVIVALVAPVAVLDTKVVVADLADRLPPTHLLDPVVDEVVALVDTTATEAQLEATANLSDPGIAMATAIDETMTATVTVTDTETATGIATATGIGIVTVTVTGMEVVRTTDARDITKTTPMMTLAPREDTESSLIPRRGSLPIPVLNKHGMLVGI